MATRNVEQITEARKHEFFEVFGDLERSLAKYGSIGCGDNEIWLPEGVEGFREFYVLLPNESLLTRELFEDIRAVLKPRRFIWIVIVHLASEAHDDRLLELSRTETVIFPESPVASYLHELFYDQRPLQ